MNQETVSIEPSPAAKAFMKEASALCGQYARRITPVEMAVALAYMTGWSLGGVSAHEKLRPALEENIQMGHQRALAEMAQAKIAGAVKRATGT